MTNQELLKLKMQGNDAGAVTIEDYLLALLTALWRQGEGFSGKRPFGNSGWEHDLYHTLVLHKVIEGEIIDGFAEDYDDCKADSIIIDLLENLELRGK